uniref:Elongation of very long chain fatty acids protein n=1 Tax=Ixodes ricinus TaxID=34613 RepID=V5IDD4_IXORI
MAYNLFQVIANAFFFVKYMRLSYVSGNYSVFCQGIDYSLKVHEMEILRISWWYLFVRIVDFMDTFFFVATKKFSHITYLHVVHHFLVVLNGWVYLAFGGGGQLIMVLCLNTVVHVVMYGYYFLSALGPRIQKHLWWKRYLTRLQISQIDLPHPTCVHSSRVRLWIPQSTHTDRPSAILRGSWTIHQLLHSIVYQKGET